MTTLYALPGTDSHLAAIKKHCLGDCQRLAVGIMICDGYPCYVCKHADCPHMEQELSGYGRAASSGEIVVMRKVQV